MPISCQAHAFGTYVPDTIISNQYLASIVETDNEWIMTRTGISQRRKLAQTENASTLGLKASLIAIQQSNFPVSKLTHLIAATCTPDYLSPSIACIIAGELNAPPVMAFDLGAACTGFIYGLSVCRSILAADPEANILFVCAEAMTRRVNWQDRGTCVLFGDAASACLLSGAYGAYGDKIFGLADVICECDGTQKDLIIVGGGTACQYKTGQPVEEDFFISMQGRETYRNAVRQMVNVCEKILRRNNLQIGDIDLFVPHQANMRIIEAVGSRLRIPLDKVFTNVANYGNTSSASIPLALAEAREAGLIKQNSKVLVTAFGAGLTWGAALLEF